MEGKPDTGPLTVSPDEAARLVGVSRTTMFSMLASGEIKSFKCGRLRLVVVASIHDWIARSLAAEAQP